ncbi:MAG: BON domain-containing protein [Planctomicrobium sp.]|jgi:osmotically-inducible protein OsmY|nr:BON domain-containing protein [Planctomicrobium sp.]
MAVATQTQTKSLLPKDLVSKVRTSLGRLSYHQLNDVICSVDVDNHITLTGHLKSYYLKQIAQTIAVKVPGVEQVTNDILVME